MSLENSQDISEEATAPSDILPLFFTSKTQEIFGCVTDELVTVENPFKIIEKKLILQDFKDRAAVSDFHPAKAIVQEYPGEELLVVYDAEFKYGQNFYLCTTEECKERILHPEVSAEGECEIGTEEEGGTQEEDIVVWKGPVTPRPWESFGSELEVQELNVVEAREKIKIRIWRKRREFGAPIKLSDHSEKTMKDAIVECLPFEDKCYSMRKLILDKGSQAILRQEEKGSQTKWKKPRNAWVQYEARFFPDKKRIEEEKSPSLLEFIKNVTPRFELALQQNEIMDVFYDDYLNLGDDDDAFGSKADSCIKEYQSFTDLLYSKEKVITHAEWHPTAKGIIAVSCSEQMSFDERVEQASRIIMTPSLILIWSFSDPIHPQLLLEAPDDIFVFKFNPSEPTIIAGGCVNGQVVLWDFSNWNDRLLSHRQTLKAKKNTMTSLPGFEDDTSTETPIVRYCAVTAIEHSHKSAVSDLQWIPDHMEIGRMGVVVENKSNYCHQLMTCAADGTILFWDTRPNKSAHHSQLTSPIKSPVAPNPSSLKQLDLTWKYILKITVGHLTGSGEFCPTKFSIAEKHGDRSSINKQPDNDVDADLNLNRTVSMTGKKDQGKILENIPTLLFVGTESGDVVYMDWKLSKDSDSGRFIANKPQLVLAAHEGLVCALVRSPFFKDILLSVGGWTFTIWKEGVSTGSLLESASSPVRLTAGAWSPTRPGVFFVTRADGNVDAWDLMDKSHEPSLTQNVTAASITCLSPFQVSKKQQLLSVGDNVGTLHILEVPWNLHRPAINEKNIIENFFDREVSRLAFVEERRNTRALEITKNKDDEKPKKQTVDTRKLIEAQENEWETKARQEYEKYLNMEKVFLQDLGFLQDDSDI